MGALVATVSKKRSAAPTLGLSLGDGQFLSLTNPGSINEMDAEQKNMAKSHLQSL